MSWYYNGPSSLPMCVFAISEDSCKSAHPRRHTRAPADRLWVSTKIRFEKQICYIVHLRVLFVFTSRHVKNDNSNTCAHAKVAQLTNTFALSCAGAILKNRPVCYGTSQLKSRICAVTRYALLKRPTLKSNKR